MSPLKAREVLLKGLVFVPDSEALWTKLLRLETKIQLLVFERESLAEKVLKDGADVVDDSAKGGNEADSGQIVGIIESESENEEAEAEIKEEKTGEVGLEQNGERFICLIRRIRIGVVFGI